MCKAFFISQPFQDMAYILFWNSDCYQYYPYENGNSLPDIENEGSNGFSNRNFLSIATVNLENTR